MALLFAVFEFCLLLQQAQQEVAFVAEQAGVVLQLDRTKDFTHELVGQIVVKSLVNQVHDEVEKEVLTGLEGLIEKIIEEEMAGKEHPVFTPPELRNSIEILILPDGRARCRYVMDMFGDAAAIWHEELEDAFAADGNVPVDESKGVIEEIKLELHDHHSRMCMTMYLDDVNKAELYDKMDVKLAKTTDGFELEVPNSFLDTINEIAVGGKLSLTLIMPGEVLQTPRGSTVNGRTATWQFDEKTLSGMEKKIARQKSRKILCGPSLIDDREMAAFVKERNEVLAKRVANLPTSSPK